MLSIFFFVFGCGKDNDKKTELSNKSAETGGKEIVKTDTETPKKQKKEIPEIKFTFVELGSVKCIPGKMMQPIMEEIEEEYELF